jgi:multidrug efflux pump subunit AcrA (membrane-fusion protein)
MKLLSVRTLLPFLLLSLGAAGFAGLILSKPKAMALEPQEKEWVVAVEPVRVETLAPELTLYGRVESPRSATLSAAVAGDVTELLALEGHRVAQGQSLAILDERDAVLHLRQRAAELAEIEADIASEHHRHESDVARLSNEKELLKLRMRSVHRMRRLQKTNAVSESLLEEALLAKEQQAILLKNREFNIRDHQARLARLEARREQAIALRDMAALDVDRTRIQAPFAGTVARVDVAPGDRVREGDSLFELYDSRALEVRAQIPTAHRETVQRALNEGVTLYAHALIGAQAARLRLDRLAGMVTSGSGGVDALFVLTEGSVDLRLGSFVQIALELTPVEDVVALPFEALYGTNRVYTFVEGRMHGVQVTRVGEWREQEAAQPRVLVHTDNLKEGDALIVTQLPNAIEGLRVKLPGS